MIKVTPRLDLEDGPKEYNTGADLTIQIKLRFRPQAGNPVHNSEDSQCELFLWEYVENDSTASPPSDPPTPIGEWLNRTEQAPTKFGAWRDFASRDPQKPCSGEETFSKIDRSRLPVKAGQSFTFWQYIVVKGGDKCGCKRVRYLVRVKYRAGRPDTIVDEFEPPYIRGRGGLPDEIFNPGLPQVLPKS